MRYRTVQILCVIAAAGVLVFAPRIGPFASGTPGPRAIGGVQKESTSIPPEIGQIMERAAELLNQHHPDLFPAISTPEAHLADGWASKINTKWSVDAIAVPHAIGDPQTYLAVFHTWHTCEADGDHIYRLVNTPEGWKIGAEIPETDPYGFRIRDHELIVDTNVSHKSVDISDRVKFDRIGEGAEFGLMRLSEDFSVSRIIMDSADKAEVPVPYAEAGGVVAFLPPAGNSFTLSMRYSGTVDHADGDFLHNDEVTLSSYWYPVTARLPATATVTATAPAGWTALAQGELVKMEPSAGAAKRVTFRNNIPVSYFTLDIGRYTVTSRQADGCTLSVYLLDPSLSLAKSCLDTTEKALTYYDAHFGAFPYTRYGIVQSRGVQSEALEAYSFATFGPHTLPDLIPHELSHTWWGGVVPCTYTRSMWNEAFADYSDSLFRRGTLPQKARTAAEVAADRRAIAHAYDVMPLAEARDTNNAAQTAIGYDKGSRVMRVLEEELGQGTMLKCMAEFVKSHKSGEPGEWAEFEAAVNRETKSDYHWFFDQWLERRGLPNVRIEDAVVKNTASGRVILADVVQHGPPYRIMMDCRITMNSGTSMVTHQRIEGERTVLQIPINQETPVSITLDPAGIIPLSPPPGADADTSYTTYVLGQ